ncbi:MAG: hypothetical protein ACRCZI_02805 [Cetobacterium sp.]
MQKPKLDTAAYLSSREDHIPSAYSSLKEDQLLNQKIRDFGVRMEGRVSRKKEAIMYAAILLFAGWLGRCASNTSVFHPCGTDTSTFCTLHDKKILYQNPGLLNISHY